MRFDRIVPVNKIINGIEPVPFLFEQAEPSFDLSVCLRVFHPGNDVVNMVLVKDLLIRMLGMIPVASRDELGTLVGQDLPRGSVVAKSLV